MLRAMPNTAAIALAGATGIAPGSRATPEDIQFTKALFDAVGRSVVLDESLIDAVTGLSGSGPAYIMLIIEALADGGVKVGLHRETALLLAAQTVYGSVMSFSPAWFPTRHWALTRQNLGVGGKGIATF